MTTIDTMRSLSWKTLARPSLEISAPVSEQAKNQRVRLMTMSSPSPTPAAGRIFSLSDRQMRIVLDTADQRIPWRWRKNFLHHVTDTLIPLTDITDDDVRQAVEAAVAKTMERVRAAR